jgi:hypothetical protein
LQQALRCRAEATTIINAEDYGRTIHDLALRRNLIVVGEDIVNAAYDAPVGASCSACLPMTPAFSNGGSFKSSSNSVPPRTGKTSRYGWRICSRF